jgi:uncharacterized protein YjbI with pentapeptide repeats
MGWERDPVANDKHLALLQQGVAIWNEWRDRNPYSSLDLSQANLPQGNFSQANLRLADLSSANLRSATLRSADLSSATLRETALSGADLSGANLRLANLSRANLSRMNFDFVLSPGEILDEDRRNLIPRNIGVSLSGANLSMANLSMADLSGANLSGANLSGADLRGANLTMVNLSGADLTEALVWETIFGDVDLTATNGLNDCRHLGPSPIDFRTLSLSKNIPLSFLRGCGLPENFIEYIPSLRDEAVQFYSCFISYSSKDQVFADRLHADLQNKGIRCWFAPHDLAIGAKTWDAIDQAIRLRDKLLLIFSKSSIESEWVEDEVNKAYAEERSRKKVVLFPIRIDNAVKATAEPWAAKLRDQRNIGDFRQWKKPEAYQKSLDRLLRDLKASGAK